MREYHACHREPIAPILGKCSYFVHERIAACEQPSDVKRPSVTPLPQIEDSFIQVESPCDFESNKSPNALQAFSAINARIFPTDLQVFICIFDFTDTQCLDNAGIFSSH